MKRKKIYFLIVIIGLIGIWWYNTFTIKITEVYITDERIKDEIKIVQITDLHGFKFGKDNRYLINKITAQQPDLIIATGDMYSSNDKRGQETALALFQHLTDLAPVYFVNGEHDSDEDFYGALTNVGVNVWNYRQQIIDVKGTKLHLFGTNNLYYSPTFDLHHEWEPCNEHFSILIAHLQNFKAFQDFGIDLALCGDTHGGQIRLPFIGSLYTDGIWLPEATGVYVHGLYQEGPHSLFISSGLGSSPIPIRLGVRPEIAVIHLKPKT